MCVSSGLVGLPWVYADCHFRLLISCQNSYVQPWLANNPYIFYQESCRCISSFLRFTSNLKTAQHEAGCYGFAHLNTWKLLQGVFEIFPFLCQFFPSYSKKAGCCVGRSNALYQERLNMSQPPFPVIKVIRSVILV